MDPTTNSGQRTLGRDIRERIDTLGGEYVRYVILILGEAIGPAAGLEKPLQTHLAT